jgi:glycosyltransferase involved in cell wall biosynthesis
MPPRPRIGFLTTWDERCGVADYSRRLVAELERHVEVRVVPAHFGPRPAREYAEQARALAECDLAHVQHTYAFFGGLHPARTGWFAFSRGLRPPAVITVHEFDDRGSAPARAYKAWFNRRVFSHPALRHWIAHAEPLAASLRALGVPADRLTCRPLPLEPPGPAPAGGTALRARWGLTGRRALVIPGFLSRRKGYDTALAALALLPPEYVLVAAGGEHGADRSHTAAWLTAEADRLGVADRLRVTGYLSEAELDGLVREADLVLAPFHEVSASASVNFALARGKAVIAADLPALRALGCLHLTPPAAPTELAAAVRAVQENAARRGELETAARGYARRHTYAGLAEDTARLYRSLLKNPVGNTDR